jgi:hypothetical protein
LGLFRRKPLHEQLAEEASLDLGRERPPVPRAFSGFLHNGGLFDAAGIHGIHRQREWDAVVTVEAELPADRVEFAALPDGTLLVEDDVRVPVGALDPLADAVEASLPPPYRAHAVRQGERVWAVAAKRIDVRAFAEEDGDEVELVEDGHVVLGRRLDGDLFEVEVTAL